MNIISIYLKKTVFLLCFLSGGIAISQPADMMWMANNSLTGDLIQAYFDVDNATLMVDGDEFVAAFRVEDLVQVGPAVQINASNRFANITIYSEFSCSPLIPGCDGLKATNVIQCPGGNCGDFILIVFDPDANGGAGGYFPMADASSPTEYDFDNNGLGFHNILNPLSPPTLTVIGPPYTSIAEVIAALPVSFASFTGNLLSSKTVSLEWITASESGNDYFSVQRSQDGITFVDLGVVEGAGDSNTPRSYGFLDITVEPGVNYYRIKQNDFDGKFSFSGVIAIDLTGGESTEVAVFPNPAADNFTVSLGREWQEGTKATMFDQNGRLIMEWVQVAGSSRNLNVQSLPTGIYQLVLRDGNTSVTKRIAVNR